MKKILVVDDETAICSALELVLCTQGFDVQIALDGKHAYDMIFRAEQEECPFDLMMTDVQMPLKTGDELIRDAIALCPDLGVVAMTGYGDRATIVSLLKSGCREFIDKPFNDDEVIEAIQKVSLAQDKRREQVRKVVLGKKRENDQLQVLVSELLNRVEKAKVNYNDLIAIDQDSIPLEFYRKMRPAADLGGDLLAVEQRSDGSICVLVADVAGHDMSASYHALLVKTLFTNYCKEVSAPEQFFHFLNEAILSKENERFVSAQLLVVNKQTRECTLTTAAHPPALFWSHKKREVSSINSDGDVIGVFQDAKFQTITLNFEDQDRIFLYTDGMIELRRKDGPTGEVTQLAVEGLKDLIHKTELDAPEQQVSKVWQGALEFCQHKVTDDMLLVSLNLVGEK